MTRLGQVYTMRRNAQARSRTQIKSKFAVVSENANFVARGEILCVCSDARSFLTFSPHFFGLPHCKQPDRAVAPSECEQLWILSVMQENRNKKRGKQRKRRPLAVFPAQEQRASKKLSYRSLGRPRFAQPNR